MTQAIRWLARILGGLVALMIVAFAFGEGSSNRSLSEVSARDAFLLLCHLATLVGILIAYRWEGIGGALIVVAYTAHLVASPRIAGMWTFYLYLIPGLLFGYCWLKGRRKRSEGTT